MIPVQTVLILLLLIIVVTYFKRLQSRLLDRLVICFFFGCALLLVLYPDFSTYIASLVGVGRGADLLFYLTIPGLTFLVIVLFSRVRDLNAMLTAVVREQALTSVTGKFPHTVSPATSETDLHKTSTTTAV